jgi:NADPH:quinone reductase-like Zn-dependent oxidoreductase
MAAIKAFLRIAARTTIFRRLIRHHGEKVEPSMKAIVYRRNGGPEVLEFSDVGKPAPGDDEVLVKVRAASINPLDWRMMRGLPGVLNFLVTGGRSRVTVPGVDVAGEVEAVGRDVTRFKPGDEVFGASKGAFAEYACTKETRLARKPERVTFEQAASVPVAGLTALQALRDKGKVQSGQRVLINGASGGVGTFAVQVARILGTLPTGVCSAGNVELVRSLGADRVVDYTREDFTRTEERYDAILDNVANHSTFSCRRILTAEGTLVIIGGPKSTGSMLWTLSTSVLPGIVLSKFGSKTVLAFIAKVDAADLATLGDWMAAGKLAPVIDRRYPLNEARAAVSYAEAGHVRGKVVLTI